MAEPAIPIQDPNRELPTRGSRAANSRLNEAAEAIGSAVGSAVETMRNLPDRVQDMKERFGVIQGRAQEKAASKADEWKWQARARTRLARLRVHQLAQDYPLHVIAGVAATGFILGFALRIRRSRRA